MSPMSYSQARDRIQDGDLIAIRSKHGGLPALTRFFTRSPYTHTAIAVWLDGGLWAAEMNAGGNVLVPMSRYEGTDFDVFACPVEPEAARLATLEKLRVKIDYGFVDLARVAWHHYARCQLPPDRGGMICSAFSAAIWLEVGWQPRFPLPTIPWPAAVVSSIGVPARFEVRT